MSVLVVAGERAFPVAVPAEGELVVGRGPQADVSLDDPKVAARHLALRQGRGALVEVRDLKAGGTRLNDVQLSGVSSARAGDQIALGDSLLLVQAASQAREPTCAPVGHEEFSRRLVAELGRARERRQLAALLLVQLPQAAPGDRQALVGQLSGATWGDFGGEVLELYAAEASQAALEVLKDQVTAALGSKGLRFKLGPALYPEDGGDAGELFETAVSRLLGPVAAAPDEPLLVDPVMVNLNALLDRVAQSEAPVLLEGAAGAGRQTFARALHARNRRAGSKFLALRCATLSEEGLDAAFRGSKEPTVYLKGLEELTPALQRRLAEVSRGSPARMVCSAAGAVALQPELAARLSTLRLALPALADRPSDVLPLAEHFLARCRRALGRPALSLSAEARRALEGYGWPGNVQELKNAVERAALVLGASDEVGLDELPQAVVTQAGEREPGAAGGLRASMRSAEKEALGRALSTTGWNVTAAAKNLGLPRRTVVYRMARLGLRRPRR